MPKFAISWNEENYDSELFDSEDDAVAEAVMSWETENEELVDGKFWIGVADPPRQPETFWDSDLFFDRVSMQDEYTLECAEDWNKSTVRQRKELDNSIREVIANWLDKHDLRPKFFLVNEAREFTIKNGVVYTGGKEWKPTQSQMA